MTRYSDDRMSVRAQSLNVLLKKYGSQLDNSRKSKYTNQSIYQCAHDWISMGNMNTDPISIAVITILLAGYGIYKGFFANQNLTDPWDDHDD